MANISVITDNKFTFELLSGKEPFLCEGNPVGFTVEDFWSFQFSNLWEMAEEVAEFLVAKALGLSMPQNKLQWTLFDMEYRGKRIEVKTTTYFHAWSPGKSCKVRTFGITKAYSEYKDSQSTFERQNDVYVFCLTDGKDQQSADPRNLDNWRFYVVPTSVINSVCGNGKHVSLGRVSNLSIPIGGVKYKDLKGAIDSVIDMINSAL